MTILKMVYLTALENIRYAEKFANIGEAVAKSCRTEYNYKKLSCGGLALWKNMMILK